MNRYIIIALVFLGIVSMSMVYQVSGVMSTHAVSMKDRLHAESIALADKLHTHATEEYHKRKDPWLAPLYKMNESFTKGVEAMSE